VNCRIKNFLFLFIVSGLLIQTLFICYFCFEKIGAPKYFIFSLVASIAFTVYSLSKGRIYFLNLDKRFLFLVFLFALSYIPAKDKLWFSQHLYSLIVVFSVYYVVSRTYMNKYFDAFLVILFVLGILEVIQSVYQLSLINAYGFMPSNKSSSLFGIFLPKISKGLRPAGSLGQPNILSMFLSLSLISALEYFKNKRRVIFAAIAVFILSFGVYITQSRGGLLDVILGVGVWFYIQPRKGVDTRMKLYLVLGIILGIVLGAIFVKLTIGALGTIERLQKIGQELGTMGRLWFWCIGILMIIKNPVLGVGLGNIKTHAWIYTKELLKYPLFKRLFVPHLKPLGISWLHNEYIHFTAETGIVGLLGMIFFIFSVVKILKILNRGEHREKYFILPFFVIFGFHSLISMPFHYPVTLFLFSIVTGILVNLTEKESSYSYTSTKIFGLIAKGIAFFLLFINLSMFYSGYNLSMAKRMITNNIRESKKYALFISRSFKNPVIGRLALETLEPYFYSTAIQGSSKTLIDRALLIELKLYYFKPTPLRAYYISRLYAKAGDKVKASKWYSVLRSMYPVEYHRITKEFPL